MITKTEVDEVIRQVERCNQTLSPFSVDRANISERQLLALLEMAKCAPVNIRGANSGAESFIRNAEEIEGSAYNDGYEAGKEDGHDKGYEEGYEAAKLDAEKVMRALKAAK